MVGTKENRPVHKGHLLLNSSQLSRQTNIKRSTNPDYVMSHDFKILLANYKYTHTHIILTLLGSETAS